MIRLIGFWGVTLALILTLAQSTHSIDIGSLADQSSYRCSGGVVAIGDTDRSVRKKCGAPLDIGRRQDFGDIWIYHRAQGQFMYYLAFLNGKLQRIVGAPCRPDNPDCFDLR